MLESIGRDKGYGSSDSVKSSWDWDRFGYLPFVFVYTDELVLMIYTLSCLSENQGHHAAFELLQEQ